MPLGMLYSYIPVCTWILSSTFWTRDSSCSLARDFISASIATAWRRYIAISARIDDVICNSKQKNPVILIQPASELFKQKKLFSPMISVPKVYSEVRNGSDLSLHVQTNKINSMIAGEVVLVCVTNIQANEVPHNSQHMACMDRVSHSHVATWPVNEAMITSITSSCSWLTHCGLVTPYGNIDLGQHWFR